MLFLVAERLMKEHGYEGAEKVLKEDPGITAKLIVDEQTPTMLKVFDTIADYILDMDMLYFGEKLKVNYNDKNCRVIGDERSYRTANDTIYECLPKVFSKDQLMQQCKMNNGEEPTDFKVRGMLRNWKKQGLITENGAMYQKKTR